MNNEEGKAVGTDLSFNKSSSEGQGTNSAVAQGGNRVFKYRFSLYIWMWKEDETLETEQTQKTQE